MNMEIELYKSKTDDIDILMTAKIDGGRLLLQGSDYGSRVDDIRGMGSGYEYAVSLDRHNSLKLFDLLDISDKTDEEKLSKIKELFGKGSGISELQKYCEGHKIKTSFFSWP